MTDRQRLNIALGTRGFKMRGDMAIIKTERGATREVGCPQPRSAIIEMTPGDPSGVFRPENMRLERFRKNPVVLRDHDYEGLPVARSLWENITYSPEGVALLTAKPQFHLDTEISREVWSHLTRGGRYRWEIGALPTKWRLCAGKLNIIEWDLLEYSCVPDEAAEEAPKPMSVACAECNSRGKPGCLVKSTKEEHPPSDLELRLACSHAEELFGGCGGAEEGDCPLPAETSMLLREVRRLRAEVTKRQAETPEHLHERLGGILRIVREANSVSISKSLAANIITMAEMGC